MSEPSADVHRVSMAEVFCLIVALLVTLPFGGIATAQQLPPGAAVRDVNPTWSFLTDYAFTYSTWTINTEDGRTVQVGTGIFAFGRPLGEKKTITRHGTVIALGLGSIYARTVDGKGPTKVRIDQGKAGLIPIVRGSF